uniref:Medium-chain acyl-CoA ligase ACSF2, mitochondrial n=1 Tax=Salarias fasciatus TaxID=181472 RepID=A0A672IYV3_SALFA
GPSLTTSYVNGTSSTPLLPLTMSQCLDATVQRWPDREALVLQQDGIRKTFAQFQRDVDQVAAGLLALGLEKGDRLGIWGPNIYEWILFQFATAKAGIIMVSLNPAYQLNEVEFTLQKVTCKAVLCPTSFKTQNYCEMLREICPEISTAAGGLIQSSRLPDLRMVIVTDSRQPGMLHIDDVLQAGESRHVKELQELQSKLTAGDPINIQFTSGTTGKPKGATLSHLNIVNNAYFVGLRMGFDKRPEVRVCLSVPMYHCFGSVLGGLCMAVHGVTLVFPSPGFDGRRSLEAIQNEKCTVVYGTPTMFTDMLGQQEANRYDLSSLEAGVMAGSPCPPAIMRKIKTVMKFEEMTVTPENQGRHLPGPVVQHRVRSIRHLRHCSADVNEWMKQQRSVSAFRDTASLNDLGYCRIEGRMKDMIIRGGENIYPAEIEEFLYKHPKVQEVQVVGVKDERLGEQVCACIRLKDGQTSSTEEIRAFCKGQISHFKIPQYVMFVDSYPLTVSGKIKKNELKEAMEKKLGL